MLNTKPATDNKGGSNEKNVILFIVRAVCLHCYNGRCHGSKNGSNKGRAYCT